MDQPGLPTDSHHRALAGLGRLNFFSRSAQLLQHRILKLAKRLDKREFTVCDIASGGGDVPLALVQLMKKRGITLRITGLDVSSVAIDYAAALATKHRLPSQLQFKQADAIHDGIAGQYDIAMSSLFLHHLDPPDGQLLLQNMASSARHLMMVNDLRRSEMGYWLAHLACRTLSRSPIVHVDGPRSVQGAFTCAEVTEMCRTVGLDKTEIVKRWPFRFLLTWERDNA